MALPDKRAAGKGQPSPARQDRLNRPLRRGARASVQELLAIADRAAAYVRHPYPGHGDLLYGDDGLPK